MNVKKVSAKTLYEGLKQEYKSSVCKLVARRLECILDDEQQEKARIAMIASSLLAESLAGDPSSCLAITEQEINGRTVLTIRYQLSHPLMPWDLHSPALLELTGNPTVDLDGLLNEIEDEEEE